MTFDTASVLTSFGAAKSELLFLRPDSHAAVPYLDLIPSIRRPAMPGEVWPEAVIEGPFGPLAYVVRSDQLDSDVELRGDQLRKLRYRLTSRAAGAMLVVASEAKIEVFPLGAGYTTAPATEVAAHSSARTFFRELATGALPTSLTGERGWYRSDWSIAGSLATLIIVATRSIERQVGLEEALLFVVRAMMIRFLLDRGLVAPAVRQDLQREPLFSTPESAKAANKWLDKQFDGVMLQSRWWSYAIFGRRYDERTRETRKLLGVLASVFAPANTMGLNWNDVAFANVRPIVLAEAIDRAITELKLPADTRKSIHYTPATLAQFMAEEAITSCNAVQPRVLVTSLDSGQFMVAALEQLVMRQWQRDGRRPSVMEIGRLMNASLRNPISDPWRQQVAAAVLSMAALDLAADAYPLSPGTFQSPLEDVMLESPAEGPFDIVLGDHANDHDYGRRALEQVPAAAGPNGLVALCIGNRVIRPVAARMPPGLRGRVRLVGIAADVTRSDRRNPVDIVFASNERPSSDSEFWLAAPFQHRWAATYLPSWIDASRSQPVSQDLAEEIPGLLAALPGMTVLEAGVLARIWRRLTNPPDTSELEDADLVMFCTTLVSEGMVGYFVRSLLGGPNGAARIKLPTAGLSRLPRAARADVVKLKSANADDKQRVALVKRLCNLDSTDVAIIADRIDGKPRQKLTPRDFGLELARRLGVFWEPGAIHVSLLEEGAAGSTFHTFAVRNFSLGPDNDLDWGSACEKMARTPVSSMGSVSTGDGCLLLWVADERLDSSSAWIATLDILRNGADELDEVNIWPSD